ncbi:hypothetical protein PWT90_01221 [Aphanocladium album]|nr:hypothetical protein PWT90_01221 [Aphanocladium album]
MQKGKRPSQSTTSRTDAAAQSVAALCDNAASLSEETGSVQFTGWTRTAYRSHITNLTRPASLEPGATHPATRVCHAKPEDDQSGRACDAVFALVQPSLAHPL